MYQRMFVELITATWQTLYMVLVGGGIATMIGFPLGIILFVTQGSSIYPRPILYRGLSSLVNVLRSIPFIILLVALLPVTRLIVGTSIGTTAAIVPLSMGAFPFVARIVESAMNTVDNGLIDMGLSIGANNRQLIHRVLLPESLPRIIDGITLMLVTLVGFSAMAGAVGGGGLGDVAIRYGYQRFDVNIMFITILLLIIIVQIIQWIGDSIARRMSH